MTKKTNVAIYCRVSSGQQSNDRQEEELVAYAKRANFTVVGIYKETASGAKDDRPFRTEVLKLARQKYISAILVTELSRWGRNTADLIATLNELKEYGTSVIALNGMQFDLSTAQGTLMTTMLSGFAEFERALLKERVRSGIASAKAKGVIVGRKKGHFYKSDQLAPDVIKSLAAGETYREIAAKLKVSMRTLFNIKKRFEEGYYDHLMRKSPKLKYLLETRK